MSKAVVAVDLKTREPRVIKVLKKRQIAIPVEVYEKRDSPIMRL